MRFGLFLLISSLPLFGQNSPFHLVSVDTPSSVETAKPAEPAVNHSSGSTTKVYRVGGDVKPPRVTTAPNPAYSEEARRAKYQGTVVLWLIVDADGVPRDIKIARSLGKGLDEKAVEAVRKWRFQPATKEGQPVAVQINVAVEFRLF